MPVRKLWEAITYNAETGDLIWKKRPLDHFSSPAAAKNWNAGYKGKVITATNADGYVVLSLGGVRLLGHRVAWALSTGQWPQGIIDHIDHNRSNNRAENLRDVTPAENARNQSMSKNNTSGRTGISWHKASGKWRAQIGYDGETYHLGVFDDLELAAHYRARALETGDFHPNHGKDNPKKQAKA